MSRRRELDLALLRGVQSVSNSGTIWFHASSQGELEILWPVLLRTVSDAGATQCALSIYSPSARVQLDRRVSEISEGMRRRILYFGFAPHEGSWTQALKKLGVAQVVTCKYEAWPDLWASISELELTLLIVAGAERTSLRWARRILALTGTGLPRLEYLCVDEHDRQTVVLDSKSSAVVVGDPRWDRVHERNRVGTPRASALAALAKDLPRPWGIVGSAWPEDIALMAPHVRNWSGTLWVVPHKTDSQHVDEIENGLKNYRSGIQRTSEWSQKSPVGCDTVLVDENGILAELYAAMDWAFVGGGYGKGVHSTLEPALHAIPIACGPARSETFAEVRQLQEVGMLTIVRSPAEFAMWMTRNIPGEAVDRKIVWKEWVRRQLGASDRTAKVLLDSMGSR